MADLHRIIERDEKTFPARTPTTVGILSPFRAQVDALTKAVNAYAQDQGLVYHLAKHQLKIGTAHSFQGEERDVMLISLALGKSDNAGSLRFLEQEDVFNVSITRARHRQVIYHSAQPEDLPPSSLLAKYLSFSGQSLTSQDQMSSENEADDFAKQFTEKCALRNISCRINQSVASIPVDVLLEKKGKFLGVDLVGYPGYTQDAVGVNRHQILERAGMKLIPVGFVEWQVQQENVIKAIEKLLNRY